MPNQMIALQARAPQTDVLGASIQRNAQMMNMMSQQRAAERQAAQAAQQMEIARAQEARAAAGEERAAAKFAIDQDALLYAKYRNMAPAVIESNNPEVYANWLAQLNAELPDRAKMIADAMPPERFNKDAFTLMMATMDQRFEARYGKAITKELIAPGPTPDSPATVLGVNISGIPGATYAAPVPDISRPRSGATPPVAGAAMAPSAGVNARATRGSATTPDDLRAQGVDPRSIPLGNPLMKPMSDTGAPAPNLGAIVQTMMDTGVVSQSNLEAMRAAAGPGKDAQLAEILRSNNIRIMPDEQPAGGMRSAVYRPEEGAAGMTQVQYNPNDYEPVRVKSPMQSPLPGSAQVPIPRVREEAKAQRKTPQEVYEETRSTKQAESDVKFLEGIGAARESAQTALGVINSMIGDARLNKAGQIEIPRGGRAPHPGFEDVVGATWRPGARFIAGTDAAGFDAYLEQVEGGAFLEAYERLKGTGQITEVEGQKATRAITRMKRSVSEAEFVKAAREFQGIIQSALDRAAQREAKLKGTAPRSETKRGATIDDLVKRYGG